MNTVSAVNNRIPISTTSYRTYNTEEFVNPDNLDQKFMQANNRQERQYIPTRTKSQPTKNYPRNITQDIVVHQDTTLQLHMKIGSRRFFALVQEKTK